MPSKQRGGSLVAVKVGVGKKVHLIPCDRKGVPTGRTICGAGRDVNGQTPGASLVKRPIPDSDRCVRCFKLKGDDDASTE